MRMMANLLQSGPSEHLNREHNSKVLLKKIDQRAEFSQIREFLIDEF